jgi:DNA-binding XRE family transcriptional regulator
MNNPTPELIKQTRKEAKLTQTKAAALIHKQLRTWAQYEAGDRKMDAAYWELFLIKISKNEVVKF